MEAAGLVVAIAPVELAPVAPVSVAVTGQTVVEMAVVSVTTVVEWAGQFVTVGAHCVLV